MAKTTMGKTRSKDNPYLTYATLNGWEWRVLKAYTADPYKPNARWFCYVTSPFTGSFGDMGDTYIADVVLTAGATLVYIDPAVNLSEVPDRRRVPQVQGW